MAVKLAGILTLFLACATAFSVPITAKAPQASATRDTVSFTIGGLGTVPGSSAKELPIQTIDHGYIASSGAVPQCFAFVRISPDGQTDPQNRCELPATIVVNDRATWSALNHKYFWWDTTIPYVDFNASTVVAVFLGIRATGGYDIRVVSAISTQYGATVHVLSTDHEPRCLVTQSFNEPYDIVAIPKTSAKVTFTIETSTTHCGY